MEYLREMLQQYKRRGHPRGLERTVTSTDNTPAIGLSQVTKPLGEAVPVSDVQSLEFFELIKQPSGV